MVVFRGAFFFLQEKEKLLGEIFRVLKKRGLAFVGGGFGKDTPGPLIRSIADESRALNDKLGRLRVSVEELRTLVKKSALTDFCRIEEQGGLWLSIEK